MSNNLLNYTNGVGHLIMSVLFTMVGLALILLTSDATLRGLGVTIILTVQAAWFIPGSAKQIATEVFKQLQVTGYIQTPQSTTTTSTTTTTTPGSNNP